MAMGTGGYERTLAGGSRSRLRRRMIAKKAGTRSGLGRGRRREGRGGRDGGPMAWAFRCRKFISECFIRECCRIEAFHWEFGCCHVALSFCLDPWLSNTTDHDSVKKKLRTRTSSIHHRIANSLNTRCYIPLSRDREYASPILHCAAHRLSHYDGCWLSTLSNYKAILVWP